ncbi:MAG: S8 family serine peptidase [Actinomycetota bacterium]|nr:S8 family serine peptidase [Actinomycetota bacterium]
MKSPARRPAVSPGNTPPAPGGGYGPQDIQAAYGLTASASANGAGQTIALIEAFRDPGAASDFATYRAYFGLPTCTVASNCFQLVDLSGGASRVDQGWEQETSLDMDAASAACPLCHILIIEAVDDSDPSLIAAVQRATSMGATVMNLSFGGCENGIGNYDTAFHQANIPIAAATGDNGYFAPDNGGCGFGTPEYPASSPYVTAVGGTHLVQGGGSRGWTETVWQFAYTQQYGGQAGGSGCSSFEAKPSWQTDSGCPARTVSDVSADADPSTGLSVFVSDPAAGGGWNVFGGTSLAAPLIAGIYALAGAPPSAVDGHIWYLGARINDVTSGSNAALTSDCNPAYLCNARPGYDGPTGVGTPSGVPMVDPTMTPLPASVSSTQITLSWSAPANVSPSSYGVWDEDLTTGSGWLPDVATTTTSTSFYGFAGHQYAFAVQWFTANGASNGRPWRVQASTTIAVNATHATPFVGMYAVDGFGLLYPGSSPPLQATFAWPGWDIARGIAASPTGEGGVVLDGWGGLHTFGDSTSASSSTYWPGWDITRTLAALPASSSTQWSGYVLDDWGGLHGFSVGGAPMPPSVSGNAYWYAWSIARDLATFSDGSGGVVLDGWGNVHPFAVGNAAQPVAAVVSAYWSGWDIARGMVLLPGSTANNYAGYVLDGWGGLHPFASIGRVMPAALDSGFYHPGWDIARSALLAPGSSTTAGYVVDGYGGFHPFGSAPAVIMPNYGIDGLIVHGAAAA